MKNGKWPENFFSLKLVYFFLRQTKDICDCTWIDNYNNMLLLPYYIFTNIADNWYNSIQDLSILSKT